MAKLDGRVAVITGSSGGIGEAIARAYACEGARLVIHSRSRDRAGRVVDAMRAEGHDALPATGDVREPDTAARLVEAAMTRWGRLDILVNNAGTSMIGPSDTLSAEGWRMTIDTNLSGAFFCAQAAAQAMLPRRSGVILNISSILGEVGLPKRAAYCAS